ncbi:primosomal protein N' [Paenibacillus curdlanolyticus YK9]|uniref:Replication restart protein PriA n=1 Tax=Paenibacillus curdlanolyticus YK9 TaxID=717606 RepID=E0I3T7_9BACL|nr:primosomal protein N' [Paenibacillus curdlanolyticus]EFM12951.1 primosomal protein N' [Paenibacillus curdlanolyticus YK9]
MIARVIVDVPSRQTDRPFDYEVPLALEGWVEAGSRVGVPFGGRVLQGFVVGVIPSEASEVDMSKIKPIAELLDPLPPLRPDLIELASWLSVKYCCTMIAALQAMLPAALKGKAERTVRLSESFEEQEPEAAAAVLLPDGLREWLRRSGPVKLDTLRERFPDAGAYVKAAIRIGLLEEQVAIRDKVSIRKVQTVIPPVDREGAAEALAAWPARAGKQRDVLAFMLDAEGPVPLQKLLADTGTTGSTVKALVDKGWLTMREVEASRDPYAGRTFQRTEPLPLTEGQQEVLKWIVASIDAREPKPYLLHGVTGSGKTEVYLQAIQRCLDQGLQAIVLVPEISLTPQMVERFKGRFGDAVAVLHSRLSTGERYDEWRKIRERRAQVAVGARSAIFAPFESIGLMIIDEEHESSYKQEESPKYHARDVAIMRAKQHGATVVLGSATPSLESFAAATAVRPSGNNGAGGGAPLLLAMPDRVAGRPMPPVTVVDMREELQGGNRSMFSRTLYAGLADRLERGEQSVLLLNRRGYSTFVMCRSCGYTAACPHCDISLTYHQKTRVLRCHYCGHSENAPSACPSCESEHIRFFGTGTQKVEEELAKLFPGIRVIRMDVDTTTEKGSHEKLLKQFGERKADVLLGTQMVAKGLDFPYVTLVGVVAADTSLHLPDFRSAERTFQLLTQVAGRAGRHELPGEVVVQSYAPEHYAIQTAQHHDYDAFVREELAHRRAMGYPPYCRLILVTMSHEQLPLLTEVGDRFAQRLRDAALAAGVYGRVDGTSGPRALDVLGPVASPIARMKDRYRFQCMIKYRGNVDATALLRETIRPFMEGSEGRGVQFGIDVDPHMIL